MMCRFERGIEKMLEDACEKDGWEPRGSDPIGGVGVVE